MRLVLSIYTPHAFKEVLLPSADNTDFAVNLSRRSSASSGGTESSVEI